MEKKIDHEYTGNVVCPYCGNENYDSWEISPSGDGDLGEQYCDNCDKKFTASRNISVDYSTEKSLCLNDEAAHDWQEIIGFPKERFMNMRRCSSCGSEKQIK